MRWTAANIATRTPRISGAQILAVGGIISAVLSSVGGMFVMPRLIGLGASIMLDANIAALVIERSAQSRRE
jgi:hypothetical protein